MENQYRQFLRTVLTACQRPLENLGMKKRRIALYSLDLSPRRIGTVGFNTGGERGPIDLRVNPLIGVTDVVADKVVQELVGLPPHRPYEASAIFRPLGYLAPLQTYFEWKFSPERPIEEEVRRMTNAVAEHGVPFMRSHDNLDAIIQKMMLRQPWGFPDVIKFYLPVTLALADRRGEAQTYIERRLDEYRDAAYPAAEQFRAFAVRFAEWKPEGAASGS